MTTRSSLSVLALFTCLILSAGCESPPTARIKDKDEENLVDDTGAGAATFERLINESIPKLLDRHRGDENGIQVRRLAFVDLQNRTRDELGEWREQLIDQILIGIDKHASFRIVSAQMVNAALREMGSPPVEQLLLPKNTRQFAKILEKEKSPVQFLMYGRLTRGGTQSGGLRQADYLLTLELINVATGDTDTVGAKVSKEFTR